MFCNRCGTENKDTAAFCRKCGEALEDGEVETRVASRPEQYVAPVGGPIEQTVHPGDEVTIFAITPTLLFVKVGYALAAVGALLLVAVTSTFAAAYVSVWLAIVLGLLLFAIPAYFHLKQKLVRYTLAETKLEIGSGLIATTTRNVPLRRIQDVTVSATVLQRLAGLGDLVIDNASEEGGKVVLKNIDSPRRYSEMLLKQMSKLEK
ncbi:MAG TPA: PH domain-containing protein [Pyrinomonadaceae bacterium]|jgi:uncharacterized membrane protein YdbT with pleckstrin-like domain|nr:PH domain-containing protein [Pyrinomonadaceae bacterium]